MPPKVDKKDPQMVFRNCKGAASTSANSSAKCDAVRPNYRSNSDPLPISEALTADEHRENLKLRRQTVRSSRSAAKLLRSLVSQDQEELWVLALCPAKSLINCKMLFRGTATACSAHPRDLFRELCRANAACFIIGHNHPSQNPMPSQEDWEVTRRLLRCAEIFQIPMIDHIVVTNDNHRSMAALQPELFLAHSRALDFSI